VFRAENKFDIDYKNGEYDEWRYTYPRILVERVKKVISNKEKKIPKLIGISSNISFFLVANWYHQT